MALWRPFETENNEAPAFIETSPEVNNKNFHFKVNELF